MESKRQAKISRLIQKELSEIFRKQTAALGGVIVSVSAVRVSPDLSIAKAYLSIFPPEKSHDILGNIQKQSKTVRYELAQAVKQVLRKCPDLQ
ncbi:MAG: ribosome-binding factor A, partial [Muribaculaceae bacterium]|nr:ribosome-binding factor A [Muribaculaceae bacterium]